MSKLRTLSLIGMPGAGKSTVGVLLAKRLGLGFIDTDLLIQMRADATLQQILDAQGYQQLRQLEQAVLLDLDAQGHLISTGGSAVYSAASMAHLKASGPVVFLDVPLHELSRRVGDHGDRGIARSPGQSFEDVFNERLPLYQKHADMTFSVDQNSAEACARLLAEQLDSDL